MEQLILLIDSDQRPTNAAEGIYLASAPGTLCSDNRDNITHRAHARKTPSQRVDERYNECGNSTVIMRGCVYVRCDEHIVLGMFNTRL